MNKLITLFSIIFIVSTSSIFSEELLLCVHGFMRTHRNMSRIEKAFTKSGWEVINWGYPSRSKMIEDHGLDLVASLKEIAEKRPGKPIHFITHSLGGVIVRSALNHPDCPHEAKIGKAVLIAPPNQGAIFARRFKSFFFFRWMMGKHAGYELMNTPSFEHIGQFPNTKEVLVIAGNLGFNPYIKESNDGKVGVKETFLSTPHMHCIVASGHSWISLSLNVIRVAKAVLLPELERAAP